MTPYLPPQGNTGSENGMGHRGNKSNMFNDAFLLVRRLLMAVAVLFAASLSASPCHAQSGPFAGLAGTWSGGGTVLFDDGSAERVSCRATYAPAGATMTMTLTCASDTYKFALSANVEDRGGAITGSWSEASPNINGSLEGRGGGGNFQVVAISAGFNAKIVLGTVGNKQSISIGADSQFHGVSINLSR